jgi:hypothetical protein
MSERQSDSPQFKAELDRHLTGERELNQLTTRQTQCERLLKLLEKYYHPDPDKWAWCPLPVILNLGIASHTRIISYLRQAGHEIECEKKWVNGEYHTRYRLVKRAEEAA